MNYINSHPIPKLSTIMSASGNTAEARVAMAIDKSGYIPGSQSSNTILQQLLTPANPQQTNSQQTTKTSGELLQLQPGQSLLAKIVAIQLLSKADVEQLQQQLIQRPAPALQQVLKQSQVYLLQLQTKASNLLALTDHPTKPLQIIQISMSNQQQARWHEATAVQSATFSDNKNTTLRSVSSSTAERTELAAQALRQVIAQQQPLQSLYRALSNIQQLSNNVSAPATDKSPPTLPEKIQRAIDQLLNRTPTLNQLGKSQPLKAAIKANGVMWESTLAKQIQAQLPLLQRGSKKISTMAELQRLALPQNNKTDIVKLLTLVNNALGDNDANTVAANTQSTPPTAASIAQNRTGLPTNLEKLVLALFGTKLHDKPQLPPAEVQKKLLRSLQQQLISSVARIQFLQLQAINRSNSTQSETAPQQPLLLEIPYRHGDNIGTLELRIQREATENEEQKKSSAKKQRAWHVSLSFELQNQGKVHAQLTVHSQNLGAKLWIEEKSLLCTAKQHLHRLHQRLEKAGISINNFQCYHGKPPQDEFTPEYALVDILT